MITRKILRQRMLNGKFDRIGQLLRHWPIIKWAKILKLRECDTQKKINGLYKFILRDALEMARYFEINLDLISDLMNAEVTERKKSGK